MAIPKVVAPWNCSGCLNCALACSFFNTPERVFNPARAHIKIHSLEGQNQFVVEFSNDCVQCGLCTERCYYGVITKE